LTCPSFFLIDLFLTFARLTRQLMRSRNSSFPLNTIMFFLFLSRDRFVIFSLQLPPPPHHRPRMCIRPFLTPLSFPTSPFPRLIFRFPHLKPPRPSVSSLFLFSLHVFLYPGPLIMPHSLAYYPRDLAASRLFPFLPAVLSSLPFMMGQDFFFRSPVYVIFKREPPDHLFSPLDYPQFQRRASCFLRYYSPVCMTCPQTRYLLFSSPVFSSSRCVILPGNNNPPFFCLAF